MSLSSPSLNKPGSKSPNAVSSSERNQSRPPATPAYILRGHSSPIHSLRFYRQNLRLISGDADGWIVIWNVVMKRPVAVWKAHEGAILTVKGRDFFDEGGYEGHIFTHGRDHKLRVWRIRSEDEETLGKVLPLEASKQPNTSKSGEPWLLHSLSVNALNFCAFSMCIGYQLKGQRGLKGELFQKSHVSLGTEVGKENLKLEEASTVDSYTLLAVPNAMDSGAVDIFYLPAEKRVCTVPSDKSINTGMLMAVELFFSVNGDLYLVSGYEDGRAMVHIRRGPILSQDLDSGPGANSAWTWERLYTYRSHSQPVLSLDVPLISPKTYFFTSSADSTIAKHSIPEAPRNVLGGTSKAESSSPLKSVNTKHAGQQDLRVRSDGKIYATAGWDSRIRVYSCKTMKELAVLKWHKEGCYAVAFADVNSDTQQSQTVPVLSPVKEEGDCEEGCKDITTAEGRGSLAAVQQQRNRKAQDTHWIAGGSKDGKISLWDIY